MNKRILTIVVVLLVIIFIMYSSSNEGYEPHNMGSRRYWGFGRQYAYSTLDHHEDHGPCYMSGQNEHRACRPGYTRFVNKYTDQNQCCVNLSNY